jgi:hypothetical protein
VTIEPGRDIFLQKTVAKHIQLLDYAKKLVETACKQ